LSDPQEIEAATDGSVNAVGTAADLSSGEPIAALLDGMPVQAHSLLANHIIIDDPDNLESRALECSANRATMVGYGALQVDAAHSYRIPLPASLERVTDPRSLSVTLAWTSPIKAGHQSYRGVKMEAAPDTPFEVFGVERGKSQPADPTCKRGSAFHEHFEGDAAVAFIDDGHLALRVWCKEDAGVADGTMIRYGVAVTIEASTPLPIYEEVQQRLRVRPRP
jgi:hypothetical protein